MLGQPLPPYAGGQVATGGRVGLLGNRSVMDTPFSQTSYTAQTIQDQQARTVGDVVRNDPSVRVVSTSGGGLDVYHIRGFYYDSGDLALNGLYGLAPYYSTAANFVERVEVLKGPNALLNGMPPAGAIGGSINLVTKQAPYFDITQLTATYQSQSQFGAEVDIARRYGAQKEFGIRFNGGYRNGRTAYDGQKDEFGNAVLNMDYRGDRVRVSADIGYQADDLFLPQRFITIAPNTFVPEPPRAGSSYGAPWSFWKPTDKFGMIQGEVDLTDSITAYGAIGRHDSHIDFRYASPAVTNIGRVGNWQALPFQGLNTFETTAGQAGVRAVVDTGPINHTLSVNYSHVDRPRGELAYRGPATVFSNLYNPVNLPLPSFATLAANLTGGLELSSVGIADVMSMWNNRLQVIVGVRRQTVENFTQDFLANTLTSYSGEAWSPAYAVLVKPVEGLTLYANYIEGLQAGSVVPNTFVNQGTIFPPFQSKQVEAGVKVDTGNITTTFAVFDIARPSVITVGVAPNARQELDGEQRNRGVEINTYGAITPSFRILGGVAFIDGELTKTQGGTNDGKVAQGVAQVNLNFGAEWDLPFVPGLTVAGRIIHTSEQFLNPANTQLIPAWNRLDLGARYTFVGPWNNKPVTVRFSVENVLNDTYWASSYTAQGVLTVGAPRTYLASTTFNF